MKICIKILFKVQKNCGELENFLFEIAYKLLYKIIIVSVHRQNRDSGPTSARFRHYGSFSPEISCFIQS